MSLDFILIPSCIFIILFLLNRENRIYRKNQKVIALAKKVKLQSDKYKKQLKTCEKKLSKNKYIFF